MRYIPKIVLILACLVLLNCKFVGAEQLLKPEALEYRQKGLSAQDQGNLSGAIEYYQKSISLVPTNAFVYNDLGVAYEAQGKLAEAEDMYLRSVAIDPNFAAAYFNLGLLYEKKGDPQRAAYYYKKRIEISLPYDYWSRQALEHLSSLSVMDPVTLRMYLETQTDELIREIKRAKLQQSRQESKELRQSEVQRLKPVRSEVRVYLNRAKRLYKRKNYIRALKELNKAYYLDPMNEEVGALLQKTQIKILLNQ